MKVVSSVPGIERSVRYFEGFPSDGVTFVDLLPVFSDAPAMRRVSNYVKALFVSTVPKIDRPTKILAAEARGFLFGGPLSLSLGVGMIPARKPGKLPGVLDEVSYELEYGTDSLAVQHGSLSKDDRVLLVDDLLATGGTARAMRDLVDLSGATVVGAMFLGELSGLDGRELLPGIRVESVLKFY